MTGQTKLKERPVSADFRPLLALLGLGLALASGAAEARTYKWVDENGVTQYTQTPPPKGDYDKIKGPGAPAVNPDKAQMDLEQRLKDYEKRRDDSQKQREESGKTSQEAAQNKADCEKSRQNLKNFELHPRMKYTDEKGNVSYMTDADRQKKMQEIRDTIKKVCK